ncbi:MAG: hypothetical protein H7Y03_04505, partial [Chitinophagaceae bacterium]|nr:hypothetical protein [Chitinophagaceae bacterium]
EKATRDFVSSLLDIEKPFWKNFIAFHQKVADLGIVISLSQVVLKLTCPGIPDLYQGCELWDLSFVDPDNRRPVDYEQRTNLLQAFHQQDNSAEDLVFRLWEDRFKGGIKLWLTHVLLKERRHQPALFSEGSYLALPVTGSGAAHILSFARRLENNWMIVVVPLNIASMAREQGKEPDTIDWKDTSIVLPDGVPAEWKNVLTGKRIKRQKELMLRDTFHHFPITVLIA